jgi:gliding motility-associated-like protein
MKRRKYFLYLFVLKVCISFSQNENNIWYFGNKAGLDFSSGSPVALTNGALYNLEGCASVSDSEGKLLFYTNGLTVWNKNHTVMLNGTGLLGGNSSSQSAIIVKQPGSQNLYYIFTAPDFTGSKFNYSIVDMDQDNGLGAVTTVKNKFLLTKASEKITVLEHANGTDYWIVTRNAYTEPAFYSFKLSCAGLDENPVVTEIGIMGFGVDVGCLKGSPKSNKIAAAYGGDVGIVEVFDFDNASGVLSNPIELKNFVNNGLKGTPYGLEFSPNNNLLYVSVFYTNLSEIYQYDFLSADETTIQNSKLLVGVDSDNTVSSLQIGVDNKIYVAKFSDYLGVLNNPNVIGIGCDYKSEGVYLQGKSSSLGLPNWHYSFNFKVDLGKDSMICKGEKFELNAETPGATYLWQDGSTSKSYIVNQKGTYIVELKLNECVTSDTIEIIEEICSQPFEMPNIFTPNNDGFNDYFTPISIGNASLIKTVIYNRWGRKVFETDNPKIDWNGAGLSSGTYYWVINYKEGNEDKKFLNGYVTLVR